MCKVCNECKSVRESGDRDDVNGSNRSEWFAFACDKAFVMFMKFYVVDVGLWWCFSRSFHFPPFNRCWNICLSNSITTTTSRRNNKRSSGSSTSSFLSLKCVFDIAKMLAFWLFSPSFCQSTKYFRHFSVLSRWWFNFYNFYCFAWQRYSHSRIFVFVSFSSFIGEAKIIQVKRVQRVNISKKEMFWVSEYYNKTSQRKPRQKPKRNFQYGSCYTQTHHFVTISILHETMSAAQVLTLILFCRQQCSANTFHYTLCK